MTFPASSLRGSTPSKPASRTNSSIASGEPMASTGGSNYAGCRFGTSGPDRSVVLLLTDIDARKQSEEKLRRSEADLLEAQRLSHCGSWRHNLASGVFSVSPEVLRIRGVDSTEPLSHIDRMYAGIHPDDRSRVRATYEAAQQQNGEFDAGYRIVLRDGTIKHLTRSAIRS